MADALSNSASSVFTEYELPTARRIFTPAAFGQAIDISQRAALTRKALKNMLDTSDMISRVQQQKVLESELQYRGAMADANRANIPADIEARRLKSQTDLERMKMEKQILPYRLKTAEADARIAAAEAPVREADAKFKLSNLGQQQEILRKSLQLAGKETDDKIARFDREADIRTLQPQIESQLDEIQPWEPDAVYRLGAFSEMIRSPQLMMKFQKSFLAARDIARQRDELVRDMSLSVDSAEGEAILQEAQKNVEAGDLLAYENARAKLRNPNVQAARQAAELRAQQMDLDRQQRSAEKEQNEENNALDYLRKAGVPSGATEESIIDQALQRMEENKVPLTDSDKAEFRRNPDAFAASRKPATRSSSSGSDTANQFNVAEYAGEIARQVAALRMLTGLKARRMREGKGPASAPSGVAPAPAKSESAEPTAPSPTSSTAMDPAQALLMRANARKSQ